MVPSLMLPSSVNFVEKSLQAFTLLKNKNTQHGLPNKSAKVDPDNIINEANITNFKAELRLSQHFLVKSWKRQTKGAQ